jgi:signal transduction histidine kinase
MARLTSDLLDVRAIELGRLSLHWKPHAIGTIAAEVVETCVPLAAKKGVSLTSGGDDATVVCDRDRILQVLWNIVTNAVKFCRDNGAVRVCTRYAGNEVFVSVTDSGPGITPEELPHVFEYFWHSSAGRGTGLGLWIARRIVEAHGGRIWIESSVGSGTTVSFTLRTAQ